MSLISKQAAVEAVEFFLVDPGDGCNDLANERNRTIEYASDKIMQIPPAKRWIPVTERLPEKHFGWCLVTLICKDGERKTDMRWYSDYAGFEDFKDETIIAWMHLPEPYENSDEGARDT